jgi:hypothetical protein
MVIGMTMIGMNSDEWHIIHDAPMLSQLIWIQQMMLHFLDKEDLVEKQDVGLVAVGAIVCNGHISNRNI